MMSPDERQRLTTLEGNYRHLSRSLYDIERRLTLALILGYGSLLGAIGLTVYLTFMKLAEN